MHDWEDMSYMGCSKHSLLISIKKLDLDLYYSHLWMLRKVSFCMNVCFGELKRAKKTSKLLESIWHLYNKQERLLSFFFLAFWSLRRAVLKEDFKEGMHYTIDYHNKYTRGQKLSWSHYKKNLISQRKETIWPNYQFHSPLLTDIPFKILLPLEIEKFPLVNYVTLVASVLEIQPRAFPKWKIKLCFAWIIHVMVFINLHHYQNTLQIAG